MENCSFEEQTLDKEQEERGPGGIKTEEVDDEGGEKDYSIAEII